MNQLQIPAAQGAWLTVGCERVAVALMLTAIAGCSSCPPFRASWYLEERQPMAPSTVVASGASSAVPVIYLALLNEGAREVRLTKVVVNPQDPKQDWWQRILPSSGARPGNMWIRSSEINGQDNGKQAEEGELPGGEKRWKPGELLLFKVVDKAFLDEEERACSLPVAVQIKCGDDCSKTQPVSGTLPNYLHTAWVHSCQPMKPLASPKQQEGTP